MNRRRDWDLQASRERLITRGATPSDAHINDGAAAKRAGITGGRVIHGGRHHAGTTSQRSTGNMKTTQRLLGHLDPKSTQRYVHAMDDDVRAALEIVDQSRNSPEPPAADKPQRQAG